MKRMTHFAIACLVVATLVNGCKHSQVVNHTPSSVVEAAQSLAPRSNPPSYTITEVVTNQQWSIIFTENVPSEKFNYYEITMLITRLPGDQSEIAIDALQINSLCPKDKKRARHIARRYAEQLAKKLK